MSATHQWEESERPPLVRELADQAFARASGAPLVSGNRVRLLRDASENYAAWLVAISSAGHTIHFENYILADDAAGQRFADALIERAQKGVQVRLIYDWLGCLGKASRRYWNRFREGGVEMRCYNPPRLGSPFGWLSRDHRKMICVDGETAFVMGLCVASTWEGNPKKKIDQWRDTGVEIQGPVVADIERAFEQTWEMTGDAIPKVERTAVGVIDPVEDVAMRIVASVPN
jgi:cardiolipin synthase